MTGKPAHLLVASHKPRKRRQVEFILRMTPQERALLTNVATALGRSVSWYIRWCCFRRLPPGTILDHVKALCEDAHGHA